MLFRSCSLCLIFVNLINMYLGVFCLGFILFGTLWFSWTWVIISFPILYDGDLSLPLGLALGSPIFPSGCEGKLGIALESPQGRRDLT